ncbi:cutinase family protein, partial [Nocardioides sp.]|uniref:RCC1 domain-containing protein n=1 Tax=Nocardioides sp. TaxID=35761 RepID=UPI00273336D9
MRRAVVLAGLLVVLLATAALPRVLEGSGDAGAAGEQRPQMAPAEAPRRAASACRDTLVVGVDGAGERPASGKVLGPTLAGWQRAYVRAMGQHGRTVEVRRLGLATSSPRTLLTRAAGRSTRSVTRARAGRWRDQVVPRGVKAAVGLLRTAASACPGQDLVLVGHAQGATVVHRTAVLLSARRPATWSRVTGVVLVSDGDRARTAGQELVGAPPAPRSGRGVLARRLAAVAPVPVGGAGVSVWNVCTRGDLVCDLRGNRVDQGLRLATSYAAGPGRKVLRRAARRLAARSRLRPAAPTVSLSAAGEVTCQTRRDGTAWCQGRNDSGQLGDGTTVARLLPAQVGSGGDWASISTSGASTCGIRAEGSLWCWGLNNRGQLGIGGRVSTSVPTRVGSHAGWTSVSTGWWHTCATRANATLWCWGRNDRGQLGRGTTDEPHNKPVRVGDTASWSTVSVGGWHTCATRDDATAWCWGAGVDGQLGTGDRARRTLPTRIGQAQAWASVTASWGHTCATTVNGSSSCWGMGDQGQLGNGATIERLTPTPVSGDIQWAHLTAGDAHTCGVDLQGSAWCWGANRYGQLGEGERIARPQPVVVVGRRS